MPGVNMEKRKYLTEYEINLLLDSANKGMNAERNYCMILMAYRHGFRISELLALTMADVDIQSGVIYVKRLKNGFSVYHPLSEDECHALSKWLILKKMTSTSVTSEAIFTTSSGAAISRSQAWKIISKCGVESNIGFRVHPHMLRHSCGYKLAERGTDTRLIQDYLGHRNIRHTVLYTKSNFNRFTGLWGSATTPPIAV